MMAQCIMKTIFIMSNVYHVKQDLKCETSVNHIIAWTLYFLMSTFLLYLY